MNPNDPKNIVITSAKTPQQDILQDVVKGLLEKQGFKVKINVFVDYTMHYKALTSKSANATFAVHTPYMDNYNNGLQDDKKKVVEIAKVHIVPFSLFSRSVTPDDWTARDTDLSDGVDTETELYKKIHGKQFIMSDSPSDYPRAYALLAAEKLLKLPEGADVWKPSLTKEQLADSAVNPYGFDFADSKKVAYDFLAQAYLKEDAAKYPIAIINGNFVLQAKLNIEWGAGSGWRLGKEETKVNGILCPYINDVNVMSGNENTPKALALAAAFNSTDVWDYIQNNSKMKDYVFQGFDRPA
ncbi:MAG: hypothetical protein LBV22_02870 [Mycoplasmataceae bacterium]|nr:hypothetical protein [Mycoplasmataceae bacterium]